ncbi:hypothetical protein BK744_00130, partial [Bacillus thuringiensis serovar zhaodongensis]|uniref:exosporium glycoprotein BclB-related protein n=1 Tax=Bacillus thuringiensis TaxID=1428 RepID=UPI000B71847A
TGATGPTGDTGLTGATGPTGAVGVTGSGAIIPYASVEPITANTILNAPSLNLGALVAFGRSTSGILVGGASIDIDTVLVDYAFVAPRDGTITSLAGFFSSSIAIALLTPVQVQLQLYRALPADTTFTPVGTPLLLGPATDLFALGTTQNGISAQAIPVTAQDKFILVVSLNSLGVNQTTAVAGFISAGITFD